MRNDSLDELLRREEIKRTKMWDPVERWRDTLEMLNWAESQAQVPRNSKEGCLATQRKLMERLK
jgi:hypothetical protein